MRYGLGQHGFNFCAGELRNGVAHHLLNGGFLALRKLRTGLGNQVRDKVWRMRIPVVAPVNTFRH